MIELTEEQLNALETEPAPLRVLNPRTRETYFLIRKEIYELVKGVVAAPNQNGWDDPEMDGYEQFRKKP